MRNQRALLLCVFLTLPLFAPPTHADLACGLTLAGSLNEMNLISSDDPEIRLTAVEAATTDRNPQRGLKTLAKGLYDPDSRVVNASLKALAHHQEAQVTLFGLARKNNAYLATLYLESTNPTIRRLAEHRLNTIFIGKEKIESLLPLIKSFLYAGGTYDFTLESFLSKTTQVLDSLALNAKTNPLVHSSNFKQKLQVYRSEFVSWSESENVVRRSKTDSTFRLAVHAHLIALSKLK